MSMCMAWVRQKNDGDEELIVATDSIFTGNGESWENGIKLFELPRTDCVIAFVGVTGKAYTLILNLISSIKLDNRLKNNYTPLIEVVEYISELFTVLIKNSISELPKDVSVHELRAEVKFLFCGWCWRENRFRIWEVGYNESTEAYLPTEQDKCSLAGLCAFIVDPSDKKEIAAQKLKEEREKKEVGANVDMEPLRVLIDISQDSSIREIGGATQIVKIYRSGTSELFGIYWQEKPYFQGRKFEEHNKPKERYFDPNTLEIIDNEILTKINLEDFATLKEFEFITTCYDEDGYLKDLADREKERLKLIFRDKAYKDFKANCEVNE